MTIDIQTVIQSSLPLGYTGSQGGTGTLGPTGFSGSASTAVGPTGFTGSVSTVIGPTGFAGSIGPTGFVGSASSAIGPTGFTGSGGTAGGSGFTGSQGTAGGTGFSGSIGFAGSNGTGSVGFTGSASTVAGFAGSFGFTGSFGYAGSIGTGFTGSSGAAGGITVTSTVSPQTNYIVGVTTTGSTATPYATTTVSYDPSTGEVSATTFTSTSDARLKTVIGPVTNALDSIKALSGVFYDWNDAAKDIGIFDGTRQVGVMAQDVQAVLPEAVRENNGYLTLSYIKLIPVLIEAIKELDKKIEALR